MNGKIVTRIAVLFIALAAIAGALVFAWPTAEPQRTASKPGAGAPAAPKSKPAPGTVTEAVEALKSLTDEVAPQTGPSDRAPSFDVARIEPSGEAVIAGQATPGAVVELMRGGVAHDRTVANPSGDFVLVPNKRLPPGNYDLTLRATEQNGKVSTSKASVAVALRSGGEEKPVVALVAPDKPAIVLSKPSTDAAVALVIEAVEGEAGGRLYVSGRAEPGARVRLYLNDAYIASATASAEGLLGFSIRSGIKPGNYRVRLDQVDASGRVQARAEVPFNAPMTVAAPAPAPSGNASVPASADPSAAPASSNESPAPKSRAAAADTPDSKPDAPAPEMAAVSASAGPPLRTAGGVTGNKTSPDRTLADPPAVTPPDRAIGMEQRQQPAIADSAPQVAKADPLPPASPDQQRQERGAIAQPSSSPKSAAPQTMPAPQAEASGATGQPRPSHAEPDSSQQPAQDATPPRTAAAEDRKHIVIVPSVETTLVIRGDNLWNISKTTYGRGARYSVIYNANRDQIRDPDLIYPGQIFVLPNEPREE